MAKAKKNTKKASVKVQDLQAKANPKGGELPTAVERSCATGVHLKEATITTR